MRGIILAGGKATRLMPLTKVTSKQLLHIYDRPMIYYPIQTLVNAGIKDILIIVAPDYAGHFLNLLGSGRDFGCKFTYEIQEEPRGLADAFLVGENFIGRKNVALILGDNIIDGEVDFSNFNGGCRIFGKSVHNPEKYGVVRFGKNNSPAEIIEKPESPPSDKAVIGLYLFDNKVVRVAKEVVPSKRGELEITSIINEYFKYNEVDYRELLNGFWEDAGSFDGLLSASNYFANKGKI